MLRFVAIFLSIASSLAQKTSTPTASFSAPTTLPTQSPTVQSTTWYQDPELACHIVVSAKENCTAAFKDTPSGSDACRACQVEQMDDHAMRASLMSCEQRDHVVTTELSKCQDECFPTNYSCSELEFYAEVCLYVFAEDCYSNRNASDSNSSDKGSSDSESSTSGVVCAAHSILGSMLVAAITWIGSVR